ncbi:MAG: glycosyltransferase family 2 protein [Bacteroidales bacterium]|jgi:glycosyltransferase involved in cell wall biosynthesis|nr:glycosyltransferase family 2 protein [Bacteroidales bacterium]
MSGFSIVIITKNEEKNLDRCLKSVEGLTDDIVVFDSGSTDNTEAIARSYHANFFTNDFKDFSDQKNRANQAAKYDWILSLDADEAFSEELKSSFLNAVSKESGAFLSMNRLTNYCGHWVKHCGWYPDWKMRFFNRKNMHWQGSIHEELVSERAFDVIKLNGHLLHYSYYTIEDHHKQARRFTELKAQRMKEKGDKDNFFLSFLSGVWKFFQIYFLKKGFLDGKSGCQIAKISAKYAMKRYHLRRV